MRRAIHLRIRLARPEAELHAFLRRAVPFYEAIPGVKIALLRLDSDPQRFVEIVGYATDEAFRADQERVESDPQMRAFLAEWRALLDGPPEVEIYTEAGI